MITAYIKYLASIRGYSPNTCRAYKKDLTEFAKWLSSHRVGASWSKISRTDIDSFIIHQQQKGLSAATTNRQLAAIAGIFRYFQREGLLTENPCKYESRRKTPSTIPATLNVEGIRKAYQKSKGVVHNMLGILAGSGIRLQELLDLQWSDIDFENNTINVSGKGMKARKVYCSGSVLDEMRSQSENALPGMKVFWVSQRNARYLIYHSLAPYCKSDKLSPHIIRHTFATELAKAGIPTADISKILGHKHLSTAQKYIDMAQITIPQKGSILT